jgi:hypothetical protein
VNESEKQELKNDINQLKEQIELLKEEMRKISDKQEESELIAQVLQTPPPKYQN